LNKVEVESYLKSFFLFFFSISILITTIFYINYTKEELSLKENILSDMRICNFDLKCEKFKIDFVPAGQKSYLKLYQNENHLYTQFPISGAKKNVLEVRFLKKDYEKALWEIKSFLLLEYIVVILVVMLFAAAFSYFSLAPLRNSLRLTQEFVKDILHDFNTPLSTLRLNASMLKREIPNNDKLQRIEKSIFSVLQLQSHLRSYLNNDKSKKEFFKLREILKENISILEKNYPNLQFYVDLDECDVNTHKDALLRIIDNLISNAVKYNKKDGSIRIIYKKNQKILEIKDTGRGIKNPSKIFDRFYKEQERGIGIGLNIVKKLCEELGISVSVESKLGEGSTFYLNIKPIIV